MNCDTLLLFLIIMNIASIISSGISIPRVQTCKNAPPAPYSCPDLRDIQDQGLAQSFNLTKFVGTTPYYELGVHDCTQPSTCGCMRSFKSFSGSPIIYNDNFTLVCPWSSSSSNSDNSSKIYESDLVFSLTTQPAIFQGYWTATPDTLYPDAVVAVSVEDSSSSETNGEDEEYRWVIEFQCVSDEKSNLAQFVAVNFYSRARVGPAADKSFNEMLAKATQLGIDQYWNSTRDGLRRVDHTGCFYE